jgi:hypothetical protein
MGMLLPRRLAHSQNPSPQHPSQFSDRLLNLSKRNCREAPANTFSPQYSIFVDFFGAQTQAGVAFAGLETRDTADLEVCGTGSPLK